MFSVLSELPTDWRHKPDGRLLRLQKVGVTPDERVDVKLREIKHVLVQMISLSKLGRLKLGEAQQAYQDVDGDLSKVSTQKGIEHQSWTWLQPGGQRWGLSHIVETSLGRCLEAQLACQHMKGPSSVIPGGCIAPVLVSLPLQLQHVNRDVGSSSMAKSSRCSQKCLLSKDWGTASMRLPVQPCPPVGPAMQTLARALSG